MTRNEALARLLQLADSNESREAKAEAHEIIVDFFLSSGDLEMARAFAGAVDWRLTP